MHKTISNSRIVQSGQFYKTVEIMLNLEVKQRINAKFLDKSPTECLYMFTKVCKNGYEVKYSVDEKR